MEMSNLLLCSYLTSIGQSLALIVHFLISKEFKEKYKSIIYRDFDSSESPFKVKKEKQDEAQKLSERRLILYAAGLALLDTTGFFFFNAPINPLSLLGLGRMVEFALNVILAVFLLRYDFYSHRKFSGAIMGFGIALSAVALFFVETTDIGTNGVFLILLLLSGIIFGCKEICTRILLFDKSVDIYKLLGYVGAFNFLYTMILNLCLLVTTCENNKIDYVLNVCEVYAHGSSEYYDKYEFFKTIKIYVDYKGVVVLSFIFYIMFTLVYYMCIYSIIYTLGPTYRITSDVISLFVITFIGIFIAKKYEDNEGVEIFAFIAYFL